MKMEIKKKQTARSTQQDQNYQITEQPMYEYRNKLRQIAKNENYIKAVDKIKEIQKRAYKKGLHST